MSRVVAILGGGASRQVGVAPMADFLDVAGDLLRCEYVEDSKDAFTRAFDGIARLQQVHSKAQFHLRNVEATGAMADGLAEPEAHFGTGGCPR
jgi:hypothetical protein